MSTGDQKNVITGELKGRCSNSSKRKN